jgi:hypothetical protein
MDRQNVSKRDGLLLYAERLSRVLRYGVRRDLSGSGPDETENGLLFGISFVLARSLTLLARFRAAALLLTGLLARPLILLAGLVPVRHVVSFDGKIITTARSPRRSDKRKWQFALLPRSARRIRARIDQLRRADSPEFRYHHMNTQ